jgi:excinuclease ABC subunit A
VRIIEVRGARQNNLRGIDVDLDPSQLTVLVGRSGSGKSSLAFDTLHAEGQRRYLEALSLRIRQTVGSLPRPAVDLITGLPPTVALAQRTSRASGGTVATRAELALPLRVLFARAGVLHCPTTGEPVVPVAHDTIVADLMSLPEGTRLTLESPVRVTGDGRGVLDEIARAGFSRVRVDGEVTRLEEVGAVGPDSDLRIVVDRVRMRADRRDRVHDAVRTAGKAGRGAIIAVAGDEERVYVDRPYSLAADRVLPELRPALFSARGPDRCPVCEGSGTVDDAPCATCGGSGLGEAARAVRLWGRVWNEVQGAPLSEVRDWLLAAPAHEGSAPVREEMVRRLGLLVEVGLADLRLSTPAAWLSTGEDQRLRLTRQVAAELSGVLLVLDEPTAGLDDRHVARVVTLLRRLVDAGNGVVVVSHHPVVVRAADRVLEFGPGPGHRGGSIVFDGDPVALASADTATGEALRGMPEVEPAAPGRGDIVLAPTTHRGRALPELRLRRGGWTCLVGPSGSGKTAALETISARLREQVDGSQAVSGADGLLRVLDTDGGHVRRSRRSMPATYVGLWDVMRSLLAQTTEGQIRGFDAGTFSLASKGGRCEHCSGQGEQRIELGFLPPVFVPCEVCEGRRFSADVLEVTWKGRNAAELLALTADEAHPLLAGHPGLERSLRALRDVGLGYVALGQPTHTLSGGEARRMKLARELSRAYRRGASDTAFLLDAPAVGLHPADVVVLARLLRRLVGEEATIVTATHDPYLVAMADRVVDLGSGDVRDR